MLSEKRKGRITASAVGSIIGVAPYTSRDDVMRRMVREYHGLAEEFTGNAATEYGTLNESKAITDFKLKSGLQVQSDSEFIISREFDWLGSTPDGFCSDGAILEIKCPFGLRNNANPPFKTLAEQPHYYAQVQTQLYCTGKKSAYFFQWNQYVNTLERVDYDPDFYVAALIKLESFYNDYLHEREHNYKKYLD